MQYNTQAAGDLWTKTTGLSYETAYRQHCHLLFLNPNADTHFTVPCGVESRVDLGGWLYTKMVYEPTNGHPSQY